MRKVIAVTFSVFIMSIIVLAIIPDRWEKIQWRWATFRDETANYKSYIQTWPEGDHIKEAGDRIQILESNKKVARARGQIHEFCSGFGIVAELSAEQIRSYMEGVANETYSTILKEPVEYYLMNKDSRSSPGKLTTVIVQPLQDQKVCFLQLEANNLSIMAVYILATSNQPPRPVFPKKWAPTMAHNGLAGPGLEIELVLQYKQEERFRKFLDTFSIFYRDMHYAVGPGTKGLVIPDLVKGSGEQKRGPFPYVGRRFKFDTGKGIGRIVYSIDGVKVGKMPDTSITTYEQALALKTFLQVLKGAKPGT